ncbi:hypothetical protein HDU82_008282 [Entophlyctis luteolus]|nr:hypothetical protein HDU82_008282 [Entophlyctis luteolus]
MAKNPFTRVDRDEQILGILSHFCDRFHLNSTSRLDNPVSGVHAGPGTGKSFFLDELGQFKLHDLDAFENAAKNPAESGAYKKRKKFTDAFRQRRNILTMSITFNSHQPIEQDRAEFSVYDSLASRILHGYLGLSWFNDAVDAFMPLVNIGGDRSRCLTAVIKHISHEFAIAQNIKESDVIFFLGIDETLKSERAMEIASVVGWLEDCDPNALGVGFFCSALTALSPKSMEGMRSISGREFKSVTTLPLKFLPPELKTKVDKSPKFKLLAADCGGHARSFELLYNTITEVGAASKSFRALAQPLVEMWRGIHLSFDILRPVVLQAKISHRKVIFGNTTADELIQIGIYLNASGSENFVPYMSPLMLQCFARFGDAEAPNKFVETMFHLSDEFEKALEKGNAPSLGKDFELYHANYEALRYLVFKSESATSNPGFLSLPAFYGALAIANRKTLRGKAKFKCPTSPEVKLDYLSDAYNAETLKEYFSDVQSEPGVICMAPAGNPGFDYAVYHETLQGTPLYVCVELKNSHTKSSTTLSIEEVKKKHKLVQRVFKKAFADKTLVQGDVALVVVAARAEDPLLKPEELPDNVYVLGKHSLFKLYGPAFSARPLFYINEKMI